MLLNATKLAVATGFTRSFIEAIKRAARDTPNDDPFHGGRFSTKREIEAWIVAHPEFRSSLAWRKKLQRPHPQRFQRQHAGRLGAQSRYGGVIADDNTT